MLTFVHQVELSFPSRTLQSSSAELKLVRRLADQLPGSVSWLGDNARRLHAWPAPSWHFGGVLVDDRESEDALVSDAADEDAYDRQAQDFKN